MAGQTDTIVGLVLARGREMPLSVTARVGGTTGQAPTLLVDLTAVVDRDSFQ